MNNTYLAVDFGAGSGRVIAGTIINGKVELQELHRFPNKPVRLEEKIYWNFLALFDEMKTGLQIAAQREFTINGIGICTWGVDYGYIDQFGCLFGNPVSYRSITSKASMMMALERIDKNNHYKRTGIQPMEINTAFRVGDNVADYSHIAYENFDLLFMPDLFSYFLCGGKAKVEYTIATTSELLNAYTRKWEKKLMKELAIPVGIFPEIIEPGTIRGKLIPDVAEELGLPLVDVIAVASHDTASAVVAIPTMEPTAAFISSGTWSLLGTVLDKPITTDAAHRAGFSNEGGIDGKINFLQNIPGLWILQRLMAEWANKGELLTYDEIISEAEESTSNSIISVDESCFQNPASMETAIRDYCVDSNQKAPSTRGEMARCVIESLAYRYKQGIDSMNKCIPSPVKQLHIIGGGCRNKLLNQLTANYLGIPVYAGPVEATAMGNILVQAWAKNEFVSIKELKETAIRSVEPQVYYPE